MSAGDPDIQHRGVHAAVVRRLRAAAMESGRRLDDGRRLRRDDTDLRRLPVHRPQSTASLLAATLLPGKRHTQKRTETIGESPGFGTGCS